MVKDPIEEVGAAQVDAVLRFLPVFEGEGYEFGHWEAPEGQMPFFSYNPEVIEFVRALYRQDFIVRFDWPSWSEEAKRYQSDPAALETAGLLTIRKLLTTHVRADRFIEGHLAEAFDQGILTAILRRLRRIRDGMAGGA